MGTQRNFWPEPTTISLLLLLIVVAIYATRSTGVHASDEITPLNNVRPPSKTLGRILEEYDALYREDVEVRRICNEIHRNLKVDGRMFFTAVDFHESGGNGLRIGDTGHTHKAYGRLQMRQMALDDLQKRGEYHHLDDIVGNNKREMANSIKAFHEYVSRYLLKSERSNINAYLNTWNAGPSGTGNETDYTRSVKAVITQLSS